MRKCTRWLALFMTLFVVTGCSPLPGEQSSSSPQSSAERSDATTDNKAPASNAITKEENNEIIFQGRYYMSKECREGPKGTHALGLFPVCDVVKVQKGELKLTRLLGVRVPEEVKEGETLWFRWKLDPSDVQVLKEAHQGGFTGAWIYCRLELIRAGDAP